MEPRKQAIMAALDKFVAQRPGMEFADYGDVKAYRAEQRSITKDRSHYQTLARAVERHDSITADDILKAAQSAYSGRLTVVAKVKVPGVGIGPYTIDYCTGQYFPTEYRRAACAVMASALWAWTREHAMPKPCNKDGDDRMYPDHASKTVVSAGDWLRAHFAREFGRHIAARWFN